jgi:hypothetical protein
MKPKYRIEGKRGFFNDALLALQRERVQYLGSNLTLLRLRCAFPLMRL